jgi:hypothetical protein
MMAVFVQLKRTAFRITVTKRCVWTVCLIVMYIRISLYFCVQETQLQFFLCQATTSINPS